MDDVIAYCERNGEKFARQYQELLRFESVSADPKRAPEVARCAQWLADHLTDVGIESVQVFPTQGHPIVYARHTGPEGSPTILIYGHYDVQPEDPVELWDSPPFDPTLRDGAMIARGAADDKGQLFVYVKALEAYLKTRKALPLTVKILLEGEEEVGSAGLSAFLAENRDELACDAVIVSDTSMFQRGLPTITYGLRGLTYMQIDLQAASSDLHSGVFGGTVANPANELAAIIATLKDADNRVAIDGFYDDVVDLSDQEKQSFSELNHDDQAFLVAVGAPALWGEKGYSTLERKWTRPALDVNGMWSGFTGEGAKTVLPCRASAKISMRLVPNQDPDRIAELFESHVRRVAPPSVTVDIANIHFGKPFLCPLDNPRLQAAARALERGFGKKPVFTREGGSIPIVAEFDETLGAPILLIGYSVPNENAHAPNEFFLMENFFGGIRSSVYLMDELTR